MRENNKFILSMRILVALVSGLMITIAQASTPLWTFSPVAGYPPNVTLSLTDMVTIQYIVTNRSHKTHTLEMKPIQGIMPSGCTSPLGYLQSCTLNLNVNASALRGDVTGGPVLCEHGNFLQCYQPSQANSLSIHLTQQPPIQQSTLTPSLSSLALSINCPLLSSCTTTKNAALTGNSRQITIQNTGVNSASNVLINASGLPSGTSITSNTCNGTLNVGDSCIITLTPGAVASSDLNNIPCTSGGIPAAGTIIISADGMLSNQVNVYVLSYGCQYQGGFLYSVDDTTPSTGSIGGKVITLVDQAGPFTTAPQASSIIWSSNGLGSIAADVNFTSILGIDELSTTLSPSPIVPPYPPGTPAFIACNGSSDGACDTNNIVSFYNFNRVLGGSPPTPLSFYAAGLCKANINGYTDWYLPAICEMESGLGIVPACLAGTQSIVQDLQFLIGNPGAISPSTSCNLPSGPPSGTNCLAGYYWSSTEFSGVPPTTAWGEFFDSITISSQGFFNKASTFGVRCSRALTF